MGAYRFGKDAKCYRGTAGSTAATEMDNVRDLTLNLSTVEADTTSRASTYFKSSKVIFLDASLEFEMLDEAGDTHLAAIKTAFMTKAAIALYPKDVTGGEGLDADFYITALNRNEPLEDVVTYSVTAKPTNENREPAWV